MSWLVIHRMAWKDPRKWLFEAEENWGSSFEGTDRRLSGTDTSLPARAVIVMRPTTRGCHLPILTDGLCQIKKRLLSRGWTKAHGAWLGRWNISALPPTGRAFQPHLLPSLPLLLPTMTLLRLPWTSCSSMFSHPWSFEHVQLEKPVWKWSPGHWSEWRWVERISKGAERWPRLVPASKRWKASWRQRLQIVLLVALSLTLHGQALSMWSKFWSEANIIVLNHILRKYSLVCLVILGGGSFLTRMRIREQQ